MGVVINRALLGAIERDLHRESWRIKTVARAALRAGIVAGHEAVRQRLTDAHTYTGLQRKAAGQGEPGRIRSGQMISDLGFYMGNESESAWFGWPSEMESFEYASAQDTGRYGARFVDDERGHVGGRYAEPNIPPAGALWEGAITARETIRELLIAAGFKPTGRA